MARILVTGASSGIGKTLYEGLAANDHEMTGASRRGPDIEVDMAVGVAVDTLLKSQQVWDHIILNHGIMPLDESEHLENIYRTNFLSYFNVLDRQLKCGDLVRQGGSFILVSSVAGVKGDMDLPFYAAMKAALINLTKSYDKSLNEQLIRVNCISPGFFKSNLVKGDPPQFLLDDVPLQREGDPVELLPVVDSLIECGYIKGQNIVVDGGLSL